MTIEQWQKLKDEGYFILVTRGTYKNQQVINYSMVKKTSETTSSIACYLNLLAVRELHKRVGFEVRPSELPACFLYKPECLQFTNHLKEPLIITYHENDVVDPILRA